MKREENPNNNLSPDRKQGLQPEKMEALCRFSGNVAHTFNNILTPKSAGLGLSTVYGLVRQMEGSIRVSSKTGEGTVFTVYIPAWK